MGTMTEDRSGKISMYDTLHAWARRKTSHFTEFLSSGFGRESDTQPPAGTELIYRLRRWPQLAAVHKTARVLRTLSVMSSQPVNRRWILSTSGLSPRQVDKLLERLDGQGVLEVIDPARFGAE